MFSTFSRSGGKGRHRHPPRGRTCMASFSFSDAAMIPLTAGQSVNRGWTSVSGNKPMGVTWHWAAIESLAATRKALGGANATNKGVSSAHYGVGRTFAEGVDRYVSLEIGRA